MDPYTISEESIAYIKDMLAAPHIQTALIPGAGHGTFMLRSGEWRDTMAVVDRFLAQGFAAPRKSSSHSH